MARLSNEATPPSKFENFTKSYPAESLESRDALFHRVQSAGALASLNPTQPFKILPPLVEVARKMKMLTLIVQSSNCQKSSLHEALL